MGTKMMYGSYDRKICAKNGCAVLLPSRQSTSILHIACISLPMFQTQDLRNASWSTRGLLSCSGIVEMIQYMLTKTSKPD